MFHKKSSKNFASIALISLLLRLLSSLQALPPMLLEGRVEPEENRSIQRNETPRVEDPRTEENLPAEKEENRSAAPPVTLPLESFEAALQANPEVARFVVKQIRQNNILLPEAADPNKPEAVRSENIQAVAVFKEALRSAYPSYPESELNTLFANLSPISPMTALPEAPALSTENIQRTLETIVQYLAKNETDLSTPSHRGNWKTWQQAIDAQDFSTARDGAVFWTGYAQGNLDKAKEHAQNHNKKVLEMTLGGEWLQKHKLYDDASFYEKSDADALWRYVSGKFVEGVLKADQISNHVVAFILDQKDPNTIYHGKEKPSLLKNPAIFLSEVPLKGTDTSSSTKFPQGLEDAFLGAKALWSSIATPHKFEQNKTLFVSESKKQSELISHQISSIHSSSSIFKPAKGIEETWNGLQSVIKKIRNNNLTEAQIEQQNDIRDFLQQAEGTTHYDWLREATQEIDYQIFKGYREQNENDLAAKWRKNCREFEEKRSEALLQGAYIGRAEGVDENEERRTTFEQANEPSTQLSNDLQQKILEQFQKLLRDTETLSSKLSSENSEEAWNKYRAKHDALFENLTNHAEKEPTWNDLVPLFEKELKLTEVIPDSEEAIELIKITRFILWNKLQEMLAHKEGKQRIKSLWETSRKLFEEAKIALNDHNEEEAKILIRHARTLGCYKGRSGAAYSLKYANKTRSQEKEDVAKLWEKSAEQHERAAGCYEECIKNKRLGDEKNAKRLEAAASAFENSAWRFKSAANALDRALKATTSEEEKIFWETNKAGHEALATYYNESADRICKGQVDEKRMKKAFNEAKQSRLSLKKAATYYEQADKEKNQEKKDKLNADAKQEQLNIKDYHELIKAIEEGNSEKEYEDAANALKQNQSRLEDAIEITEKEKTTGDSLFRRFFSHF